MVSDMWSFCDFMYIVQELLGLLRCESNHWNLQENWQVLQKSNIGSLCDHICHIGWSLSTIHSHLPPCQKGSQLPNPLVWVEVEWLLLSHGLELVISFGGRSLSVIGSPLVVLEAAGGVFFLVFFAFLVAMCLLTMVGMGKNGNHHVMRHWDVSPDYKQNCRCYTTPTSPFLFVAPANFLVDSNDPICISTDPVVLVQYTESHKNFT